MNRPLTQSLQIQLLERRDELQKTIDDVESSGDLARLLVEVDRALERFGTDDYGRCRVCGDHMDDVEMEENPLRQYCLCDLTEYGRADLQRDLDLAWQIQASLLPPQNLSHAQWQVSYRYQPAGPVSGDYCDVITNQADEESLHFLVGDVSGKGVAASYLMSHLSALVRRTLDVPTSVDCLMDIVNRHLNERSPSTHFVTMVSGRAHSSGLVEISNAGHCRPLVLRHDGQRELDSTGLPVGISDEASYPVLNSQLSPGDSIVLFTDGISEAQNPLGEFYGEEKLARVAAAHRNEPPARLAAACVDSVHEFRGSAAVTDDLTLMVLRYG